MSFGQGVVVDTAALTRFLATDPGAQEVLLEVSEQIGSFVEEVAPSKTGYYKRHIEIKRFRTWYRVLNTDPFAHLVEWGSANTDDSLGRRHPGNPPYLPFRQAIFASGLRFLPGKGRDE